MFTRDDMVPAINSSKHAAIGGAGRPRAVISRLLCALAFLALPGLASAEIYKCTMDGKMVYPHIGCEDGVVEQTDKAVESVHDLHPSWFDIPPRLQQIPVCSAIACHCGGRLIPLQKKEDQRLMSALLGLDELWQNHQHELSRYSILQDPTPVDLADLRASACDVAVGQLVIKSLYNTVAADIIQASEAQHQDDRAAVPGCQATSATSFSPGHGNRYHGDCNHRLQTAGRSNSRQTAPIYDMLLDSLESLRQPRRAY